jgi:hypothetical protein
MSIQFRIGMDETIRQGCSFMDHIREGLIPAVLGTAVTATGYALKQSRKVDSTLSDTIVGFGLAHIVLGAIDLVEHRHHY